MKYLKKFNESKENFDYDGLEEFCYENLMPLIDEGFDVYISGWGDNYKIYFMKKEHNSSFYWKDISDDFITFYEMLKSKYKLYDYLDDSSNPCYVELNLFNPNKLRNSSITNIDNINLYDKDIYHDYDLTPFKLAAVEIIVDTN